MASQAFQRWWADANRLTHSQLISVLNGDSALVTTTGGEVALNLLPLVNDVLHTVSGPLSAMTGGAVSLPPVTAIAAAACHAIGGTASSTCTQIPLFPAAALAGPRHAYRVLAAVLPLVLILTMLTLAGALAASPRRRRTLLQMTIGGTLTVLTVMAAVSWGKSSLIDRAAPRYQAVTSVIVHALTTGFFTMTIWCVAGGFAITAIVLLTGPYRWTTAIRAAIRIGRLPDVIVAATALQIAARSVAETLGIRHVYAAYCPAVLPSPHHAPPPPPRPPATRSYESGTPSGPTPAPARPGFRPLACHFSGCLLDVAVFLIP
jgi:hypothetical protein